MLTEPVKPRKSLPSVSQLTALAGGDAAAASQQPGAGQQPAAGAAAGVSGRPSKLEAAVAAGQQLTKNQKKKLRQKQKKKEGEGEGEEQSASAADSEPTTGSGAAAAEGGGGAGQEASSGGSGDAAANGDGTPGDQQQGATQAPAAEGQQQGGQQPPAAPAVDLQQLQEQLLHMSAKIVDFGNACWTHKHFTDDIQTRQYRSPEVSRTAYGVACKGTACVPRAWQASQPPVHPEMLACTLCTMPAYACTDSTGHKVSWRRALPMRAALVSLAHSDAVALRRAAGQGAPGPPHSLEHYFLAPTPPQHAHLSSTRFPWALLFGTRAPHSSLPLCPHRCIISPPASLAGGASPAQLPTHPPTHPPT
jgi:hypothetical protein